MLGLTTSNAPPEVEPAMTRIASPWDWTKALVVGLGPTNVASIELERIAVMASPPALKVCVSMVTLLPSAAAKKPFVMPTSAGACVRFGKYPSRSVSGWSSLGAAELTVWPQATRTIMASGVASILSVFMR